MKIELWSEIVSVLDCENYEITTQLNAHESTKLNFFH